MSGTVNFTPKIAALEKKGMPIINFAIGEPDLPVPKEVITATKHALDNKLTKYENVYGLDSLRRHIGLKEHVAKEEIIITNPHALAIIAEDLPKNSSNNSTSLR